MFIEDEHFITSSKVLFAATDAFDQRIRAVDTQIASAVSSLTDDEVLSLDADEWASRVAQELMIDAPQVDIEAAELLTLGRIEVDCTGKPGISYSMNEIQVLRPGYRFRIKVPVTGDSGLLVFRPSAGMEPLRADLADGYIVRSWDWPKELGTDTFDRSVEAFKHTLAVGTERVARDLNELNKHIAGRARAALDQRRQAVLSERDFLGALKVPVKPAPDAPKPLRAPPMRRRPTPARALAEVGGAAPVEDAPDMSEFYEHIIELIRAVGRGIERSPGSFAQAEEETLRDHMLVTLNSHYEGRAYAEAFNRSGKTDILIRIHDRNAFIGECKKWGGAKKLNEALNQLFGYTTWRDSRLALIFYVREKNPSSIVEKARAEMQDRREFISWEDPDRDGEFRCRVRWPDDPEREAMLTALFFHIG
jgi:hypothetical protein